MQDVSGFKGQTVLRYSIDENKKKMLYKHKDLLKKLY